MKNLKKVIIIYFSIIVAFVIISKLFGAQIFYMLQSQGLWLMPIFVILPTQIVGVLIASILEKPQLKQKIFNISYSVAFIGFVFTTLYLQYSSWRHKRDFGNIEANQDHFKNSSGPYMAEEKIAFDSLSKLLVDPNSFKLVGGRIDTRDTILDGHAQTIIYSMLRYRKENQEATLKAKFAVINNTAHLIYYDIPLDREDNIVIDSIRQAVIDSVNNAIKAIPDSLKKEIKKNFDSVVNQ
jgi:hypothetical protein